MQTTKYLCVVLLALICVIISACVSTAPVQAKEEPPEIPDVVCDDGKFYLIYEKRKLAIEYQGAICVVKKEKGKV